jgi:PPP family 3-phenylpropionic acid transporter
MAAGARILLAYLVYFSAIGASFAYLPLFYRELGLQLAEIDVLNAVQAAVVLTFGPVWGGLMDRFPRAGHTLPLSASVALVGAFTLFLGNDFAGALLGSAVLFAGIAGIGPTLDARTLETLGPDRRERYGQVRAFGSLAFVVVTILVGQLLAANGVRALFWVYLPCLLATVVVTATVRRRGDNRSVSLFRGAGEILRAPGLGVFFAGFILVWTALAAANTFFSIQVAALGGSTALVGLAWAIGAAIEVPIMYAFPRLSRRFGASRLLVTGTVVLALRGLLSSIAPDAVALVMVAPLEGVGFALVFVGSVTTLGAQVHASLGGTAQGLLTASGGLAAIAGSAVGGTVADAVGIGGMFAGAGLVGLLGTAIIALGLGRFGPVAAGQPERLAERTASLGTAG